MNLAKRLFRHFVSILPNLIKIIIYRKVYGWKIGNNVRIGAFTIIDSQEVVLKNNVKIGRSNLIANLKHFEIGEKSIIGSQNTFCGNRNNRREWENSIVIGGNCGITSNHYFDACGGISIGDNVTIGGMGTQIWSHELSIEKGSNILKSVKIGTNVYVASSVLISPGASIPSNITVGLGAVVSAKLQSDDGDLIVGNPAIAKKRNLKIVHKINESF